MPLSLSRAIFNLLEEKKAISIPEKNAEKNKEITIIVNIITQKLVRLNINDTTYVEYFIIFKTMIRVKSATIYYFVFQFYFNGIIR